MISDARMTNSIWIFKLCSPTVPFSFTSFPRIANNSPRSSWQTLLPNRPDLGYCLMNYDNANCLICKTFRWRRNRIRRCYSRIQDRGNLHTLREVIGSVIRWRRFKGLSERKLNGRRAFHSLLAWMWTERIILRYLIARYRFEI